MDLRVLRGGPRSLSHLCPGYWRSAEAHERFRGGTPPPGALPASGAATPTGATEGAARGARSTALAEPWYVERDAWRDLKARVDAGDLVLLETVALTQRSGFWDAVEQGTQNLRSRAEFHSLLDVRTARASNVTPIPIVQEAG